MKQPSSNFNRASSGRSLNPAAITADLILGERRLLDAVIHL